jgi:hypothetical protein
MRLTKKHLHIYEFVTFWTSLAAIAAFAVVLIMRERTIEGLVGLAFFTYCVFFVREPPLRSFSGYVEWREDRHPQLRGVVLVPYAVPVLLVLAFIDWIIGW